MRSIFYFLCFWALYNTPLLLKAQISPRMPRFALGASVDGRIISNTYIGFLTTTGLSLECNILDLKGWVLQGRTGLLWAFYDGRYAVFPLEIRTGFHLKKFGILVGLGTLRGENGLYGDNKKMPSISILARFKHPHRRFFLDIYTNALKIRTYDFFNNAFDYVGRYYFWGAGVNLGLFLGKIKK